jgi:hypothetical protein
MTCTVEVFFALNAEGGPYFTLNDPVQGELDNTTYLLFGELPVDVTDAVRGVSISRGRSSPLDSFDAGTCAVTLNNMDRRFDPTFTGGPFFGELVPGKRCRVTCEGVVIFDGNIEDWALEYEPSGFATATFTAADRLGALANRFFLQHTTTAGQTPGQRITSTLNRAEVSFPAGPRSINAGAATLQADAVSWGSNVLNYLQLVEKTEQGYLFASRSNVLTFKGRRDLLNPVPVVEFTDDGTGVPYQTIELDYGSELLFTRVQVDREGGTNQTATDSAAVAAFGTRTLSLGELLFDDDTQSSDLADDLLAQFSAPKLRVKGLSVVLPGLDSAHATATAGLDLTDLVRVRFQQQPNTAGGFGASAFGTSAFGSPPPDGLVSIVIVESVEHDVTPDQHVVRFGFADTRAGLFLTLDDPTLGRLDNNVLAL